LQKNLSSIEWLHFAFFEAKWNKTYNLSTVPASCSNSLAERAVKIDDMKKISEGSLRQKLAHFLFSYHGTPQSTTGVAPSELLMGRKLKSELDLLHPSKQVMINVQNRGL